MDPESAWNEMLAAFAENNFADAESSAESLLNWIERGGFAPRTVSIAIPDEWNRAICGYVCREVLRATGTSGE